MCRGLPQTRGARAGCLRCRRALRLSPGVEKRNMSKRTRHTRQMARQQTTAKKEDATTKKGKAAARGERENVKSKSTCAAETASERYAPRVEMARKTKTATNQLAELQTAVALKVRATKTYQTAAQGRVGGNEVRARCKLEGATELPSEKGAVWKDRVDEKDKTKKPTIEMAKSRADSSSSIKAPKATKGQRRHKAKPSKIQKPLPVVLGQRDKTAFAREKTENRGLPKPKAARRPAGSIKKKYDKPMAMAML